jgi:hypothetical protein
MTYGGGAFTMILMVSKLRLQTAFLISFDLAIRLEKQLKQLLVRFSDLRVTRVTPRNGQLSYPIANAE